MKPSVILKLLSFLVIFLPPQVLATYYYNTEEIQQQIISQAKRHDIAPSLALAIAKVESNFNPEALSHSGAKGVMQIMPRTAEQAFGVSRERLFEPEINIELGIKFIKRLLDRYENRVEIALSHYNGGSGVKSRDGKLRVMPATKNYVQKVLRTQQTFLDHDKPHLFLEANYINNERSRYAEAELFDSDLAMELAMIDTPTENSQIETLRALRLHNITRNYQSKTKTPRYKNNTESVNPQPIDVSRDAKIAKVRQWESIYLD
ncbi:lytic transglycosylase domain-containing protein [Paraglaciecola arctica]|uniref:lytic transglycosylase domain-containing protein n=1 Tax=Paraglaciecola arctica TaxID=1128911 RepID=UPI001C07CB88|nr:lytic transglycosylase domain-containing protein [Paraglaciecola arctica]MBU3003123.1 lytic transglycosylase domain-containing protein [Paraglaciecola arctica]